MWRGAGTGGRAFASSLLWTVGSEVLVTATDGTREDLPVATFGVLPAAESFTGRRLPLSFSLTLAAEEGRYFFGVVIESSGKVAACRPTLALGTGVGELFKLTPELSYRFGVLEASRDSLCLSI